MAGKTKVAFVGSGGIAKAHVKSLSASRNVSLVAFCDVNLDSAKEVAAQCDALAFAEADEMFEKVEIDAAYFCLPPFAHGAEMLAVEKGIPFLVEKPVDLDLKRAQKIAAAAKAKGVISCAAYMNRYRRGIQTVKKLLAKDPAVWITGGWVGGTPAASPSGIVSWWIQKDKSGGQFHEQVTHTVDLARFLCGEAVSVHALVAKGFNKRAPKHYSIEDAALVNIKFASGAIANLFASCSTNVGGSGVTLNVYANYTTALFSGWEHSVRILQAGKEEKTLAGEPNIFDLENAAFIKAVRTGDPSPILSTYEDGVKSAQVSLAANKSMETGKAVALA